MATSILSLFTPPEDILVSQQQQNQARQAAIAQQGSQFGVFAPLYQAGLRNIDTAAQALFPTQDPRLQRATMIQGIISNYADKDTTDPAVLAQMSKDFAAIGATREAFVLSQDASKLRLQQEELGIKRATAGREARKSEREELEFYKKNPEQTGPILQALATQLEQDPSNPVLLDRYNKIAGAGATGAVEASQKEQKDKLDTERVQSIIDKNRKEINKIDKDNFDAGTRWNFERQAAIDLLSSYGYKPGDKLKGADQINTELQNAQEKSLREVWGSSTKPTATPRTPAPPAAPAASTSIKSAVEAAGQQYEPDKYEYRIGPTGQLERKLK